MTTEQQSSSPSGNETLGDRLRRFDEQRKEARVAQRSANLQFLIPIITQQLLDAQKKGSAFLDFELVPNIQGERVRQYEGCIKDITQDIVVWAHKEGLKPTIRSTSIELAW